MFGHDDKDDNEQQEPTAAEPVVVEPETEDASQMGPLDISPSAPDIADAPLSDSSLDDLLNNTGGTSAQTQASAPASDDVNNLLDIKRDALQALSPLLDHLDQTPEERFRTTMMLIQASDNKELVKEAYQAATGIKDDKERAQALLDVVNEINYFTQSSVA